MSLNFHPYFTILYAIEIKCLSLRSWLSYIQSYNYILWRTLLTTYKAQSYDIANFTIETVLLVSFFKKFYEKID